MAVEGDRRGRLVPVKAWSQAPGEPRDCDSTPDPLACFEAVRAAFPRRVERLERRLLPLAGVDLDEFVVRTTRLAAREARDAFGSVWVGRRVRVDVRHRAARVGGSAELTVFRTSARPRFEVRARAALRSPDATWAIVLVRYCGIPFEYGYDEVRPVFVPMQDDQGYVDPGR